MAEQLKVLVVDDEEPIRDSCRQVLTKAGYDCHTAVDGIEGLHFAHQVEPDLVLLDLMMPGIDGLECSSSSARPTRTSSASSLPDTRPSSRPSTR